MKDSQRPNHAWQRLPRLSGGRAFDLMLAAATAGVVAVTAVAVFHLRATVTAAATPSAGAAAAQTVSPAPALLPTAAAVPPPPTPDPTPNPTPAQPNGPAQPASVSLARQQSHLPARPPTRLTPGSPPPVIPASAARHG